MEYASLMEYSLAGNTRAFRSLPQATIQAWLVQDPVHVLQSAPPSWAAHLNTYGWKEARLEGGPVPEASAAQMLLLRDIAQAFNDSEWVGPLRDLLCKLAPSEDSGVSTGSVLEPGVPGGSAQELWVKREPGMPGTGLPPTTALSASVLSSVGRREACDLIRTGMRKQAFAAWEAVFLA